MFQKITAFIKDTRTEMMRVVWPTREAIIRDTIVVIAVTLGLAAFLGILDVVFQYLLNRFIL